MSVELGIAPNELLDTPNEVFVAMLEYLEDRRLRMENERRRA